MLKIQIFRRKKQSNAPHFPNDVKKENKGIIQCHINACQISYHQYPIAYSCKYYHDIYCIPLISNTSINITVSPQCYRHNHNHDHHLYNTCYTTTHILTHAPPPPQHIPPVPSNAPPIPPIPIPLSPRYQYIPPA